MSKIPLTLTFDVQGLEALIDEIVALLTQVSDFPPEIRDELVRLADTPQEFFAFKVDRPTTPGAVECVVCLDPTDRLRRLMVALGAGDVD